MARGITMATNNQANDRYNPPGTAQPDFEEYNFEDLEQGELFWLNTEKSDNNHAHRKLSDTEALNVKAQEYVQFGRHANVFYKM